MSWSVISWSDDHGSSPDAVPSRFERRAVALESGSLFMERLAVTPADILEYNRGKSTTLPKSRRRRRNSMPSNNVLEDDRWSTRLASLLASRSTRPSGPHGFS